MTATPRGNPGTSQSLPSGVVTFAFTDIEGSTARWERDRAAMQDAVRLHDAILRAAIEQHRGYVFKTIGDAFCSAFERPDDAIAAMVTAQRALAAADFSAIDGLRVRAAVHSGTADVRDGDYAGPPLDRVGRLLSIGHGGQILVTAQTVALVEGALPEGVSLRDLGAYHLKNAPEAQRVYQVVAPELPMEFPPLRSRETLAADDAIVDAAAFHPVPSFSGRDPELAAVQVALAHDGAIAVVQGLGGLGKSSVVREYGWRNRDRYSVVWWLNAQTEAGIIEGLVRLGAMFVQGLDQLTDVRAAAQRVVNSVLSGFEQPVLLVFDNLEDEPLLRAWLPRMARALATSRDAAWSADITVVALQTWPLETAIAYLQTASGRTDVKHDDAAAIADALGELPLALAHAAAALRTMRMVSPQRYLEHINEFLKNAPRGADYPRSVAATFSTAIAQAEQQAPGAAAVLCFAACFAPGAIPDELFRLTADHYAEGLVPVLTDGAALDLRFVMGDELRLDEALGALDRLSLLAFAQDEQTYDMHRLVQLAARDLAGEGAEAWFGCAVSVTEAAFPDQGDVAMWPQCERLLPHVRAALDGIPNDSAYLPAGRLAGQCSHYLWERGQYTAAGHMAERALAIQEKALEPEHPGVAKALNRLGMVYNELGRYAEAEQLLARALAISEKTLGPDDLRLAGDLNNLAVVFHNQGRYLEAELLYMRALSIREKIHGPDHPGVALALTNLAEIYRMQGRFAEAESLSTRSVQAWEKGLGPDHPEVAKGLNILAFVYASQGRSAEAESTHARALAVRQKALGPDHPDVAQSLNSLAELYRMLGRYAEAEPLLTRALSIRERALGPDHPLTKETREALDAVDSH